MKEQLREELTRKVAFLMDKFFVSEARAPRLVNFSDHVDIFLESPNRGDPDNQIKIDVFKLSVLSILSPFRSCFKAK